MGEGGAVDLHSPNSPAMSTQTSSMLFVQILLLAIPILSAPIIFNSNITGRESGLELLLIGIIGAEFVFLGIYGFRNSRAKEKLDLREKKSEFELTLVCPHCDAQFFQIVSLDKSTDPNSVIDSSCRLCGGVGSVQPLPLD